MGWELGRNIVEVVCDGVAVGTQRGGLLLTALDDRFGELDERQESAFGDI